ncbi:glycoside hydrolase family 99-like domain-containing protein [Jiangella sp. DSM 45060]|uniref:glycoside hydrolase family 99-like domain-containing protein n=1 Tax=Jiangella sp. DSM 45060 TaxID=1798224 RepID=UPI0012FD075C|nr:glycoside hydrolase family 99-like domain-containing protein [Jiangella sp. DSM 45060]
MRPDVLAYYFPHWHADARDAEWISPGFTEWELVEKAVPRFPGHRQPRVPLLGHRDESDPAVMESEVRLASEHGIDGFLFDFYWYDDGPYLQDALDRGFLGRAPGGPPFRFALMWANHDLVDVYPLPAPTSRTRPRLLRPGAVGRDAFDAMADHLVAAYFTRPDYYTVAGRPFFSVYELGTFVAAMGGADAAADALRSLDDKARRAGLPGVHLDVVVWGTGVLPNHVTIDRPMEILRALPVASTSSYTWMHHVDLAAHPFPVGDWDRVREEAFGHYRAYPGELAVPFLPNISVGWDSSPRTSADGPWEHNPGYGWTPVFECSAASIAKAAADATELLAAQPDAPPIVTVNAWNEWTEGSYLLPDTDRGAALLQALAAAFPR